MFKKISTNEKAHFTAKKDKNIKKKKNI